MSFAMDLPDTPNSQVFSHPNKLPSELGGWINGLSKQYDTLCQIANETADANHVAEVARNVWTVLCDALVLCQMWLTSTEEVSKLPNLSESSIRNYGRLIEERKRAIERIAELIRTMAVVWDDLDLTVPDEIAEAVWTVRISPLAYLRAMWNLFWSSIRHPFTETSIELRTGRVLLTD